MANQSRLKILGIGLVLVGLGSFVLSVGFIPPGALSVWMAFGGWFLPIIGLGCYARAKQRSVFWAAMGLVLIVGPILALAAIGIDDVLAKCATPHWIRRVVNVGFVLSACALFLAIAIPNFLRFSQRSPQAEAREVLRSIYYAEKAFYQKHERYSTFEEIGFELEKTNTRYTYHINRSGEPGTVYEAEVRPPTLDNMVIHAGVSTDGQSFTATATANLDNDDTLDQWHVNDSQRRPFHDVDDGKL